MALESSEHLCTVLLGQLAFTPSSVAVEANAAAVYPTGASNVSINRCQADAKQVSIGVRPIRLQGGCFEDTK